MFLVSIRRVRSEIILKGINLGAIEDSFLR
jgi:hypothetical protein